METVPPDVTNAMRQLETQAALSMVLAEVRSLRDQLEGIRIGLQNDRLALAEARGTSSCRPGRSRIRG